MTREQTKQYYLEHKEQIKTRSKQYYKNHAEQIKKYKQQYRKEHLEQEKQRKKRYYLIHSQQYNKRYKEHRLIRLEQIKQWQNNNYDKWLETQRKHTYKRQRNLGFEPLNEYFENSEFHHLNKEDGLFIPKELHRSIYHCLETGQNMNEINTLTVQWWIFQVIKQKHKYLI